MIQRIQSLYLFFASLLFVSICFFSFGSLKMTDGTDALYKAQGLWNNGSPVYRIELLQVLFIATALWIFSTIFYFKRRIIQMRLCIVAFVISILDAGIIFYYWYKFNSEISHSMSSIYLTAFLPLLSAVLIFFAYRGIKKDDNLVKSVDRIR